MQFTTSSQTGRNAGRHGDGPHPAGLKPGDMASSMQSARAGLTPQSRRQTPSPWRLRTTLASPLACRAWSSPPARGGKVVRGGKRSRHAPLLAGVAAPAPAAPGAAQHWRSSARPPTRPPHPRPTQHHVAAADGDAGQQGVVALWHQHRPAVAGACHFGSGVDGALDGGAVVCGGRGRASTLQAGHALPGGEAAPGHAALAAACRSKRRTSNTHVHLTSRSQPGTTPHLCHFRWLHSPAH